MTNRYQSAEYLRAQASVSRQAAATCGYFEQKNRARLAQAADRLERDARIAAQAEKLLEAADAVAEQQLPLATISTELARSALRLAYLAGRRDQQQEVA